MGFSAYSLYALPTDDLIRTAALSMSTEDSAYPITNVQNEDPADTAKSTTTSTVVTITVPSSTPRALSIINTNATSIVLTNAAGMASQAQIVPSRTVDGKQINGFKDMDGVLLRTSTVFTLTMSKTGTSPLEVGRIVLVTALRELVWLPNVEFGIARPGAVRNRTRLGSVARRLSPTWKRSGTGQFLDVSELANLRAWEAAGNGLGYGALLIPDRRVNDAWFVQPAEDGVKWTGGDAQIDLKLALEEISMGLPPALT